MLRCREHRSSFATARAAAKGLISLWSRGSTGAYTPMDSSNEKSWMTLGCVLRAVPADSMMLPA